MYTVILRSEPEGGYTVLVPSLPGCVTYGETIDEALRMAEEAMLGCILGLEDLGKPVPEDGPFIALPAEVVTGTLLVYRLSRKGEVVEVA